MANRGQDRLEDGPQLTIPAEGDGAERTGLISRVRISAHREIVIGDLGVPEQ